MNGGLQRFLGGSPGAVLLRLVLLSLVVGVVLSAFNLTPRTILREIGHLIRRIYDMGFDAVEWIVEYFVLGAVIVIPIFIVVRLISIAQRRS